MKRSVGLAAASLVGALALAACGSSSGSKGGGASTTSTTKSSSTSSTSGASATATLQLADTSLTKVIAGSDGKVLYLYKPDGTAEASTVPAAILKAWPPLFESTSLPEQSFAWVGSTSLFGPASKP